jgi:hypothetical protein
MREYLVEGATGGFDFIVDRTKPFIHENRVDGKLAFTRIPGRFSVCDCINGNNRRYSRNVWEKNLKDGSPLQESIKRNAAFGLLEHPKDGIVTLLSPISHIVTKAQMVEGTGQSGQKVYEVVGEIALLETQEGIKLKALIEGGYNPLVSSRGYGSLSKAADGVDEVCEDYVCESWDVVIKPSFESAELQPQRPLSTTTSHVAKSAAESASVTPPPAQSSLTEQKQDLKEAKPSSFAAHQGEHSEKLTSAQPKIMELREIQRSISMLESVDPAKLTPSQFAEQMAMVEELHQEVATYAAVEPKRAWDGQKLHRQLERVSSRFAETAQAPSKVARKLTENNTKLMKVINAVASTAVTYKKKLGEALKSDGHKTKLIEELTSRGQGWHKVAEARKGKLTQVQEDFDSSCEALDIMAKRYHEDTTELGRRVLQLEFKDALAAKPELQKKLKEATRLRHIAAIREELEGKKVQENEPGVGKPTDGEDPDKKAMKGAKKGDGEGAGDKVAEEPGKVANESKDSKKDGKTVVTESKVSPPEQKKSVTEGKVLLSNTADPRDLNESVDIVKRLSAANTR